MSSAQNGRLVFGSQELWRQVYFALQDSATIETLDAFRAAWEAAAVDPEESIAKAIYGWRWPDDHDFWQYGPRSMATATRAVLAALGVPQSSGGTS